MLPICQAGVGEGQEHVRDRERRETNKDEPEQGHRMPQRCDLRVDNTSGYDGEKHRWCCSKSDVSQTSQPLLLRCFKEVAWTVQKTEVAGKVKKRRQEQA